ncbi:hypothetical protein QJS10_CPB19g01596 [Acorus calamus]|uniref:Outer arm dynein light chain 1 protein n=1 Tax=Acorus calamus TaxID=4465 RepID=A0AAV9CJW5_ACOCL|nr:hypothetical protein QJS10_CPB19g01596 [Acorus calamus]
MAAVVTGDRYLDHLVRFVERQAGSLLDGTLVLKLNPAGLRYVQSRLEALEEVEGLLAGAPVDYLRAYVSELGDHRALEQLRRILRLLPSLKVVSALPPPAPRDPTPLWLAAFGRLRSLELRGCDLSTSAARGLLELRHTLERIVCHNSTLLFGIHQGHCNIKAPKDALRHVFTSRIVDIKDSPLWNRLSFVSCPCNGMILMDESLQLLHVVETLDLSRNRFAKVDNLRKCTKLKHLDLGFNQLRTIASLGEVTCPVVKVVLRNNALTSLRGIENLNSVEGLDLSYNIISNFSELEILLKVDDKGIDAREFWEMNIIIASRQKRPSGYGFYHPAKDEANDKSSFNAKGKRLSRLACIEDDEQRKYHGLDGDQDSPSGSDNPRREEGTISDGEAEIVDLISRVEFMKKERSVLWLREFKEWMDQNASVVDSKFVGLDMGLGNENYIKTKHGCKLLGESSSILDPDTPADTSIIVHKHEQLNSEGKAVTESSLMDGRRMMDYVIIREGEGVAEESVKSDSDESLDYSPLEVTDSSTIVTDKRTSQTEHEKESPDSPQLTVINKIMESRPSSVYPGSPPHYEVDILHRRQYLEEEYMHLPIESHSMASSDSDSSCSDDNLDVSSSEEVHEGDKHGDSSSKDSIGAKSDSCSELFTETVEHSKAKHGDPCFNNSVFDNGSIDHDQITNGDVVCLNRKMKRRPQKRVISLVEENSIIRNTNAQPQKLNGKVEFNDDVKDGNRKKNDNENGFLWSGKEVDKHKALTGKEIDSLICEAGDISLSKTKRSYEESIENYFRRHIADSSASETCDEFIHCDCLVKQGSEYQERKVVVLLSSEKKLYVILVDGVDDGEGANLYVLGCHRLEDVKEVVVGLGLQALRFYT